MLFFTAVGCLLIVLIARPLASLLRGVDHDGRLLLPVLDELLVRSVLPLWHPATLLKSRLQHGQYGGLVGMRIGRAQVKTTERDQIVSQSTLDAVQSEKE